MTTHIIRAACMGSSSRSLVQPMRVQLELAKRVGQSRVLSGLHYLFFKLLDFSDEN
jgi:hypothetical protein